MKFPAQINLFIKTFVYLMQRNLTKNHIYTIVCKGIPCNVSQQVTLQNTFSIYMIFQVDDSGNCDFKSSNEEILSEILTG